MSLEVLRHDAEAASPYRDRVLELWPTAFEPVPDEDDWRSRFWEQHRGRADFRLVTAEIGGRLVGFSWGYTGERGQWWSDTVHAALGDAGDGWIGGHFEFVELAVRPEHRGSGIGGALHDALLEGLDHERALLQTDADPASAGHRLYLARGWQVIGALSEQKAVLGKHLRG